MGKTARVVVVLAALLAAPAGAHGVELSLGGAWMANLHNVIRVGASDVQLGWSHDLEWSTLRAGVHWMTFFPTDQVDPVLGVRFGWSVFRELGPVRGRVGLGVGAYWTRPAPVLPIGYLEVGVERAFGPWTVGASVSGMLSLFGAGFEPRVTLGRTF